MGTPAWGCLANSPKILRCRPSLALSGPVLISFSLLATTHLKEVALWGYVAERDPTLADCSLSGTPPPAPHPTLETGILIWFFPDPLCVTHHLSGSQLS